MAATPHAQFGKLPERIGPEDTAEERTHDRVPMSHRGGRRRPLPRHDSDRLTMRTRNRPSTRRTAQLSVLR
ncbi:hypothetical protein [Streptomyces sp. NBC_01217]|uniref:hypothetical protein n=1 Tax=Streptomyces sp. NBC_01217 TaxID=2903779 RepID=UPI002E15AF4D|nr:hypothetical protein OG507_04205 [Streptomyces sp. NBC_01217]